MDARIHTQTLTDSGNTSSTEGNRSVCVRDGEGSCREQGVQPLHRRKGEEEEEEEVEEDGGGAEECPQERMASLEILSRQLQEDIQGKPTTLPMLPTQNHRDRMDPPSERQPGGQVVSLVRASKSSRSPLGLFVRLLCETSGPYWKSAVRLEMLPLWKTILCLCVNTSMIDFTV